MLGITSLCIDIALGVVLGAVPDFNFSAMFVIFGSTCSEACFLTESISAPFGGQRKFFRIRPHITISLISFVSKCYLAFSKLIAGLRPMTMTILQIAYIDWLWAPFPPSKKAGWSLAGFCIKNTKWRFLSLVSAKKSLFWRARPLHQILNEACSVAACAVEHINWALAKLRLGLNLLAFRI